MSRSRASDSPAGAGSGADAPPPATPGRREAAAWGAVGALSYLVLVQGYFLVTDRPPDLSVLAVGAVAVGAVAALVARTLGRLFAKRRV